MNCCFWLLWNDINSFPTKLHTCTIRHKRKLLCNKILVWIDLKAMQQQVKCYCWCIKLCYVHAFSKHQLYTLMITNHYPYQKTRCRPCVTRSKTIDVSIICIFYLSAYISYRPCVTGIIAISVKCLRCSNFVCKHLCWYLRHPNNIGFHRWKGQISSEF